MAQGLGQEVEGALRAALVEVAPGLAVEALEELEEEVRRAILERLGARRAELEKTERRVCAGAVR